MRNFMKMLLYFFVCVILVLCLLYVIGGKLMLPSICESHSLECFQFKKCPSFCKALNFTYSRSSLFNLKDSDWCKSSIQVYMPEDCETRDKCFVQRVGTNCSESESKFSHEFPEKLKVNCSFHLTTGELCNPDAIEDGWIKCCENPSLENCNCK